MSLVNDALKRAKENQQSNSPAAPPLEFKPVEHGQRRTRNSLLLAGLSLVGIAIVSLSIALAWVISQKDKSVLLVQAATNPKPAPQTNAPVQPARSAKPPVTVADISTSQPVVEAAPDLAVINDSSATQSTPAIIEAAKPTPLKLQGIFFNPSNPSAVVSGKTVYLGERVGSFFVLGISPTAVTLANQTATNVLSLSE